MVDPAGPPLDDDADADVVGNRRFQHRLHDARRGDPRTLRWVWDTYAGPITGFLMALGTPEVEEVVNDVFIAAFAQLDRFDGDEARFRAWLHAIARHKRIDQLRRLQRCPPTALLDDRDLPSSDDVEATALRQLADEELMEVLGALTSDQRDVIVLRFISGLSLMQTALAVDKPVGAVKAMQHRALAQLRKTSGTTRIPPAPVQRSRR